MWWVALSFAMLQLGQPEIVVAAGQARAEAQAIDKSFDAHSQMQLAKARRTSMKGAKGAEREAGYWASAVAYAAVGVHWPDAGLLLLMEAAYREGECWRVLGESGRAVGAFAEVCSLASGGGFDENGRKLISPARGLSRKETSERGVWHARAWLERGHCARRGEIWLRALTCYSKALAVRAAPLRQKNDAREWLAKTHFKVANWQEAVEFFGDWAEHAETPAEKVRARDGQARAWLGLASSAEADATISAHGLAQAQQCMVSLQTEMATLVRDPGKEGESVRKALARMVTPGLLAEQAVTAEVSIASLAEAKPASKARPQSP